MTPTLAQIFAWEVVGTAVLIVLGNGVVAASNLKHSHFSGGGAVMIQLGWGFGVFAGASIAWRSGAHLNPAVTLGLAAADKLGWDKVPVYIAAQMLGAFIGASLCWLAYKRNFDEEPEPQNTLGIFATGPAVKSYGWNLVTEVIGTFVLVFWILQSPGLTGSFTGTGDPVGFGNAALGYAGVAFVVITVGAGLGGPTGYAINPARDLGPRIAYAVLPIRGKGSPQWDYAWVPVVGPLLGGVLAALLTTALGHV